MYGDRSESTGSLEIRKGQPLKLDWERLDSHQGRSLGKGQKVEREG